MIQSFFESHYREIDRTRQMTDQEVVIDTVQNFFDDSNQKRRLCACLGQNCSRSSIEFLSKILWFCLYSLLLLENSSFKNLWQINCLVGTFVYCSWVHYTLTKNMNNLILQKSNLHIIGRSVRDGQVTTYLQLVQTWNISTKIWHSYFIITRNHCTMLCWK